MEGYCVRCKTKRSMNDEKEVTMGKGRRAAKGVCSNCGTKMMRFLPNK